MAKTDFERLGGEAALRSLIDDFVEREVQDTLIGFHFRGVDRDRLKELEYELSARLLGARIRYTGRPLREAHARHPILGGQFMRRQQILRETLGDHGAPEDVIERWLQHNESLRDQITSDPGSECDAEAAGLRAPPARDAGED